MRLIFLFLLFYNIVFSQNAVTNDAIKPKLPREIGLNLGRYFFSEYGLNGFYKVRKSEKKSTKENWSLQTNYRFSGGYFIQNPENYIRTDENISVRFHYRDSVYSQKNTTGYLMIGLEKLRKHNEHSYWYGYQFGIYSARRTQLHSYQRFDGETLLVANRFSDIYKDLGFLIDLNSGYKYALTDRINLGIEFSFWWTTVYAYGISKDTLGNKTKSNSFNFDGRFNLMNSVFVAYNF
jgi:hypothetical protein